MCDEKAYPALERMTPRTELLLRLITLSFLMLLGAPAMAKSFQPVSRLACPDGDFIVDARPYGENEAAGSAVEMRYRYKGTELAELSYEGRYASLAPYLRQGNPPIYNFGLRLDSDGKGGYGGQYENGPTLYLPPSDFSAAETERLATCIAERHAAIRSDFERAVITSSTFLGLMKTRAKLGIDGIARIVHADAPIVGLYGDDGYCVVIERGGRVLLHTTYTGNTASGAVVWGVVESRPSGRPVLRARQRIVFAGEEREGKHYLLAANFRGRLLKDDYMVVLE